MHSDRDSIPLGGDRAARRHAWSSGTPVTADGEFGLIARIRGLATGAACDELALGIGDDAALLRVAEGWELALTGDMQIEGRHFLRDWVSPREAGARAAEVNLSDIAAMGATPLVALVSLGLAPDLSRDALDQFYAGLNGALATHHAVIAGGNITASDIFLVDLTLVGRVESGQALRRAGARRDDIVFVTGYPGRAGAFLEMLRGAGPLRGARGESGTSQPRGMPESDLIERLRLAHAAPRARVAQGRFLLENRVASAAIDQSDGIGGDLAHVCEESGVGVILEEGALPIDRDLARLGTHLGIDPVTWVLGPSDDYELIFTAPRDKADLAFAMASALGVAVTPIGVVTAGPPQVMLRKASGDLGSVPRGWDHLRT